MKKVALFVLVALALPATADAKGPSKALIVGPGVTAIRISGAEGSQTPFWRVTETTGWFEAAWGPSRLPGQPPPGELGPRYTIIWTVPSSSKLRQDVYPYARPAPVTYMPRGQKIYGTPVKGGWFVGGAKLKRALVSVGVPAQAPPTDAPPSASREPAHRSSSSSGGLSTGAIAGIVAAAAVLTLALGLAVRARRRPRPIGG